MGLAEFAQKNWDQCRLSSAMLELTYRCNLDCVFCYNDLGRRATPLTLSQYKSLLDDLAELNTLSVTLSGGEPTAHPHFFEIGAYAKALGFVIRIKTNGHALRKRLVERIKQEIDPYMIELSLHGATPETHDKLTRVPGSFDRLCANLRELANAGLRYKLNVPLTRWNADEVPGMYALADGLGVKLDVYPNLSPKDNGDRSPLELSASVLQRKQLQKFLSDRHARNKASIQKLSAQNTKTTDASQRQAPKMNCGAGTSSLVVDPYGDVIACVEWRFPLGNLHKNTIKEIWSESPQLRTVRNLNESAGRVRDELKQQHGAISFCPGLAEKLTGSPVRAYPGLIN